MTTDFSHLVYEFHRAKKAYVRSAPGFPPPEVLLTRVRLMTEELAETIIAMHERDLVAVADGLADLLYVTFGTALSFGLPIEAIFEEVHRANMSKLALNEHGKGGKGEGYEPPNLLSIIGRALAHPVE